jgi:SAM-dependent methyltransferase
MKKLPEIDVSYGGLYRMLFAPVRSKLLLTGIELKVFSHLSELRSADAVAEAIGTHPRNTRVFLDGLAAIDLLEKRDGLYRNSPVSQAFLVEGNPTYIGQILTFMARTDAPLENLSKLIKEGPPPQPEKSQFSEEMLAQGAHMMANSERAGDAQLLLKIVSKLPEFPLLKKMLDLGGGPGIIGTAIVAAHPNMKGVIFDLPAVVKVAERFIKEDNMEDRMEVLGGDFNRDSIGEGYDLILACNTLQFARDIDFVMKKVYNALNENGVFVSIFPFGQTHERTKPENVVLGLLSLTLTGQDVGFDQGFVADSMLRVGFRSVRSKPLVIDWGQVELDIPRK